MRNELITLVTKYPDGTEVKTKKIELWAEKKSVTRTEYYAAIASKLKPKYVFDINPEEYHLADETIDEKTYHATHVQYEGFLLEIIRTFDKSMDSMEMTVG